MLEPPSTTSKTCLKTRSSTGKRATSQRADCSSEWRFRARLYTIEKQDFGTVKMSLPYLLSKHFVHTKSGLVDVDQNTSNQALKSIFEWYNVFSSLADGTLDAGFVAEKRPRRRKYPYRRKDGFDVEFPEDAKGGSSGKKFAQEPGR